MLTPVITYYLEMAPNDFRPAWNTAADVEVRQAKVPCAALSRFLYATVGANWHWVDRLDWNDDDWLAYLNRPELETWLGYQDGTPFGYFELEAQPEAAVNIAYFGLLPQFIGRGLGRHLLSSAIARAIEMQAERVWVYTCSLDHPSALANYQARGFHVFKQEASHKELPARLTRQHPPQNPMP